MLNWLRSAYDRATGAITSTIAGWVHDVVAGLYSFLHIIFGDVRGAWKDLVGASEAIYHALDEFGDETAHAFGILFRHWIPGILKWIQTDIVRPLLEAVSWIAHEGATIWHYITHPADLVLLIWDAFIARLEATAWDTAEALGKFAVALIWKNIDKFITLLEDVLDAIL
jgi:hypothetical protein